MAPRKRFAEKLKHLRESLEEMSTLVEASLENLFFSIENRDKMLAQQIVADDRNVNSLEPVSYTHLLFAAALIYLVSVSFLSALMERLERRLRVNER